MLIFWNIAHLFRAKPSHCYSLMRREPTTDERKISPILVKKENPALPSIYRKQDAGFFLLIWHIYKYHPRFNEKKLHFYFLSFVVGPAPLSRLFIVQFAFGFL